MRFNVSHRNQSKFERRGLRNYFEYRDLGIGNVLGAFMGGPLTPDRRRVTDRTMQLFSEKVIPALR